MDSRDVFLDRITISNTRPEDGNGVYDTVRLAYGVDLNTPCPTCVGADDVRQQLERFPEGQFVAHFHTPNEPSLVVGMASTMRTSRTPNDPPEAWLTAIGSLGIANHEPNGEWLYGVEMTVRPEYRRMGIGTRLYEARFDLVRRLNLRGWYAGGVLMGYHRYHNMLSPLEYAEAVIRREVIDPTVTMQMNRGFEAITPIPDYLPETRAGNMAVLIVWHNPDYDPERETRA